MMETRGMKRMLLSLYLSFLVGLVICLSVLPCIEAQSLRAKSAATSTKHSSYDNLDVDDSTINLRGDDNSRRKNNNNEEGDHHQQQLQKQRGLGFSDFGNTNPSPPSSRFDGLDFFHNPFRQQNEPAPSDTTVRAPTDAPVDPAPQATPMPATPQTTPMPVTPQTPMPATPQTPMPVTPQTPMPVTPQTTPAPVTPQTPMPVTPQTPMPVTPQTTPAPVSTTPAPVPAPSPAPVEPTVLCSILGNLCSQVPCCEPNHVCGRITGGFFVKNKNHHNVVDLANFVL